MLCFRYRALLIGYAECELDERTTARVEAHIARCPSCASELEMIRSVSGAIKAAEHPAMEPAPDLWSKVSARIEREAPRPAPRIWLRVTQATSACAAAVLVAAIGIGLMRPIPPSEHRSAPKVGAIAEAPAEIAMPRTEKLTQLARKQHAPPPRGNRPARLPARQPAPTYTRRYFANAAKPRPAPAVGEPVTTLAMLRDDDYSSGGASKGRVAKLEADAEGVGIAGRSAAAGKPSPPASRGALSVPAFGTAVVCVDELASVEALVPACKPTPPASGGTSSAIALGTSVASADGVESVELKCATEASALKAASESVTTNFFRYDIGKDSDMLFKADASALGRGLAPRVAGGAYVGKNLRMAGYGSARNNALPPGGGSVVDELNKTEGVRVVALFSYP